MNSYLDTNFPEIKWFFRKVKQFVVQSSDIQEIQKAAEQWQKVQNFKDRLQKGNFKRGQPPLFYKEFSQLEDFGEVLRNDLSLWLGDPARAWVKTSEVRADTPVSNNKVALDYYKNIIQEFQWMDISGIDTERAFRIPLSDMYVRLRVMLDEDSQLDSDDESQDSGPINIQTALDRYHRLVIVGDPGSGKSTFLRFIALIMARSVTEDDPSLASERLTLEPPLPSLFSCLVGT